MIVQFQTDIWGTPYPPTTGIYVSVLLRVVMWRAIPVFDTPKNFSNIRPLKKPPVKFSHIYICGILGAGEGLFRNST